LCFRKIFFAGILPIFLGNQAQLNWNPSFQFASLSSDLANRLHK